MISHRSNRVELLESRRLLSGASLSHHGLLDVIGSPSFANTISVEYDSTQANIDVTIAFINRKLVTTNISKTFPTGDVTSIYIRGGNAADTISVGENLVGVLPATRVDALAGADTVIGADESTVVNAGLGADTVTLGNGADTVRGSFGADVITVGNGTDKVDGGFGNDTIVTGSGADTVNGGFGNDVITTHDVTDSVLVHGGPGNDSVTTGNGNDTIWGDAGNDTIVSGSGKDTFGCIAGSNTVTATGTAGNTYFGKRSEAYFKAHNSVVDYNPSIDTLVIKPGEAATPVV